MTATGPQARADFVHGLQSFMSEGRILARFSDHPCIVSVLNLFELNHTGYLVMGYLDGMTLDWKDSLIQSGFAFDNPHAKKSCGCGTSFSA